MSPAGENEVRVALDFLERVNAFQLPDLAAVTDDIELITVGGVGGGKVSFRGHDGLREFTGDPETSAWAVMRVHADELRWRGERLVILGRIERRGRASDLTFADEFALVFEFVDGLIHRVEAFMSHEEALGMAG